MTEKNKEKETKKENKKQTQKTPKTLEKQFDMLKYKHSIQSRLSDLSQEKKKKLKLELNDKYNNEFGDLDMSEEEQKKYYELKEKLMPEEAQKGIEKVKRLKHELVKSPSSDKFEGFTKQNLQKTHKDTEPSEEFVRIALTNLPGELLSLFNQYFTLRFVKTEWEDPKTKKGKKANDLLQKINGGAYVEKYKDTKSGLDKFRINVDKESFWEDTTVNYGGVEFEAERFNRSKFLYVVTRSILSTVQNKGELKEIFEKNKNIKNKKLDSNCDMNYEDWLAYFLTNPEQAKKMDPELYDQAKQWLKNSFEKSNMIDTSKAPSSTIIKASKIDYKKIITPEKYIDPKTGEEIKSKGWLNFFGFAKKLGLGWPAMQIYGIADYIEGIKIAYQEAGQFYMTEIYEKEIKYLKSRDLGGGDYQKLLRQPLYYNDKDRMRALLMVIAGKNAYHWQYGQLWLWRFDKKFRDTNGEEVSFEGFDFITKLAKLSGGENKVAGTVEYKQKGNKFVRMKRENQIQRFDAIFENFSLRDIQRAKPDMFNNLFDPESQKFIKLDAELGQKHMEGRDEYYIQNDVNLNDVLPPDEAKKFVSDMVKYGKNNSDKGFNRLVDPVVESLIKKYLQESRREPMLFNMYTAPRVKKAFEYYKDYIDTPDYEQKEYDSTYNELKETLQKNNYDFEESLEDMSYEDIERLYKDFYKEKRDMPYTRGKLVTKYGKLKEIMRQSHTKFRNNVSQLNLPDQINNYLNTKIQNLSTKDSISIEDIDKFNADIDETLSKIEPSKAKNVRNYLKDFLTHLENYSIVKGYQNIFRPYSSELNKYSGKGTAMKSKDIEKNRNWILFELMPEKTSLSKKISDIERKFEGKISFSKSEKDKILSEEDKIGQSILIDIVNKKLTEAGANKDKAFMNDYTKLNTLYFNINQKIQFPSEISESFEDFLEEFKELNLIPDSQKNKPENLKQLQSLLTVAKEVSDDYYDEKMNRANYRYGRDMLGYNTDIEEELEEMEAELG